MRRVWVSRIACRSWSTTRWTRASAGSSPRWWVKRCGVCFFFSSRRRHTRLQGDWSSDVCSSDLGISADLYLQLSGQTPEQLAEGVRAEAAQSVARELVLEAAADKLGIEVSDDEVEELIREQAEAAGEDPDEVVAQIRESGRFETLRADLRLKETLDRIVSEVKRISPDLAEVRDKLWTPDKETAPTETKLWTPASKEPA